LERCPLGAISFGKEITFVPRKIDIENVRKLRKNRNFIVLTEPGKIPDALVKVLGEKSG
jgi:flavoprotein